MNIFSKIKQDHDEARAVMDKILVTEEVATRLDMFRMLKVAILSHAKSEEKTFYLALKRTHDEGLAEEVPYLKKEHKEVEELFEEIEGIDPNAKEWWEKFGELRQGLTHHMEEEEKKIFKDAKKEIPLGEARELGERMGDLEEQEKSRLESDENQAA